MKAAEVLMHCLQKEGVEVLFGYPGGTVLPIYDVIYDFPIKHVLVRHEQGAAHAADGYARANGKVGVCIATSGPGATNLITGIATAYMDSIPMVALTGQVGSALIGKDAFQEADITGITLPISKHTYQLKDPKDLPRIIREAFYIASTNRPGPVVIDLPKNTMEADIKYDPHAEPKMQIPGYQLVPAPDPDSIAQAVRLIKAAKRPVLYVGGGAITAGASEEIIKLAEQMNIPVTTTLMGLGAFPSAHPLSLGMLGMHGSRYTNYAVSECDLLIAAGARFDDRVTGKLESFVSKARIVHLDIDPAEINKNVPVDVSVIANLKDSLQAINTLLANTEQHSGIEWQTTIARWKREFPLTYDDQSDTGIMPQYIIEKLSELTQGQAIITTEVGQNQMWAAQFYQCKYPRTFLSSGGLGTMGYGLPAAIGAACARDDVPVIDIAGDGSIQMNIQELSTAVQYKLPVIICILNNHYLGMVKQWQALFYNNRFSHTDMYEHQPDFVKLAEAYGAIGMRVTQKEQVETALKQALQVKDRPVMIDFVVQREANVFPMVPPGAAIINMLGGGTPDEN